MYKVTVLLWKSLSSDENARHNVIVLIFGVLVVEKWPHHNDVIMRAMASEITSLKIVYPTGLFRRKSKKTLKRRVTGLCEWNSSVTGDFPAQRAGNADNVSI